MTETSQVFTSFAGCDIVLHLNEEVIGEMEWIQFDEDLKTGKVEGFIDIIVFDHRYKNLKEAFVAEGDKDILIRYANDSLGRMESFIANVDFTKRRVINSVDATHIVHRYFFTASGVDDHF